MLVAVQIVFGFVLLVGGGELLVQGAAALAGAFKISPLVIGLTVVAFGTSAPELGVSLQAALTGNPDVAVGNVVGSNIINVLLILGAVGAGHAAGCLESADSARRSADDRGLVVHVGDGRRRQHRSLGRCVDVRSLDRLYRVLHSQESQRASGCAR